MYKCKYCGKEYEKIRALSGHTSHCSNNPNHRTHKENSARAKKARETYILEHPEKYVKKTYKLKCKRCGGEYSLELTEQEYSKGKYTKYCSLACRNKRRHSEETKRKIAKSIVENGNLYITPCKVYYCKYCNKPFTIKDERNCGGRQYCSAECCDKWLQENFYFDKTHGYGKSGWYKGIHCDSSWELAFVIYHLEHNLYIERCKESRLYIYKGKTYKYYPDFITNEGIIEIKGYKNEKWYAKVEQNKDVKVLYKKEMQPYLEYTIKKYGKDFINLYE